MPTLREHLNSGPFTLALSAGFFGFYAHAGVLRALLDAGLAPARVTGSSAGAIVGGAHAAGVSTDAIRAQLTALRRKDFWDPGVGAGLLRGARYRALLDGLLSGVQTEHTPIPCAISVWEIARFRTRVVQSGSLAAAVHASSALPGLFHPVKVDGRWCTDGGVRDKNALASVQPGERVLLHHLPDGSSQRGSRQPLPIAGAAGRWDPTQDAARAHPLRVARPDVVAVALLNLPRVHPFRLQDGTAAYDAAATRMRALLDAEHAPLLMR